MHRHREVNGRRLRLTARIAASLALVLVAGPLHAQIAASPRLPPSETSCDYRRCALTIAPRWNGLAVVTGDGRSTVANLHFLFPRDVITSLTGPSPGAVVGADSTVAYARRAVRLRRMGAALTDAGLLLGAAAAAYATFDNRRRGSAATVAATGGALLIVSIPLQFAADGALSRAVWWHNLRYAR